MRTKIVAGLLLLTLLSACIGTGGDESRLLPGTAGNDVRTHDANGSFRVLYSFGATPYDGALPASNLVAFNGSLYGTTYKGGTEGVGTIFEVTPDGSETVAHSFGELYGDGSFPQEELTNFDGALYGVTPDGGKVSMGRIFRLNADGSYDMLHSFGGGRDGQMPLGGLEPLNGALYGSTCEGGRYGWGTIFRLHKNGTKQVIFSFDRYDGSCPAFTLTALKGDLFGTAIGGGRYQQGTLIRISTTGTGRALYSFGRKGDGYGPEGAMLAVKGTLYDATSAGGSKNDGTIFTAKATGRETVIHDFGGGSKSPCRPTASLTEVNGVIYGTTSEGGGPNCSGYGTVFRMNANRTVTVVHAFKDVSQGANPFAGLLYFNGKLYGTTAGGGKYGAGTIFVLTP